MDKINGDNLNGEILAVISAAVAALYTRPGYNLVVRSIKRIGATSPVWNTTGRIERLSRKLNS